MAVTRRESVFLQLLGNGSPDKFIGVYAVPGRLPELLRYPGESAQAFCNRALHHAAGTGGIWARLMYASDAGVADSGQRKGVAPKGTSRGIPTRVIRTTKKN